MFYQIFFTYKVLLSCEQAIHLSNMLAHKIVIISSGYTHTDYILLVLRLRSVYSIIKWFIVFQAPLKLQLWKH
jgi:hypothetical protein